MSDFSYFSLFTAGLACLVPFTAAYTKPVGAEPEGNPISQPGLNSVVPAGSNFTITWEPTTKGTVTLVLLKGPSSNAVPQYAIVEKTENDGTYVWEVKDDLEPTANAQGYGIQLIDDETGQYQYTTQFGISNDHYEKPKSYSSSTKEASYPTHSEKKPYPTNIWTTYCSESTTITYGHKTYTVTKPTYLTLTKPETYHAYPTGTAPHSWSKSHNVTMVQPTAYAPTTVKTSASATSSIASATYEVPATSTGGANSLALSAFGLVAAAGAAVLAI